MKELRAEGNEDIGEIFKNPASGAQVRIMKRPKKRYKTDAPEKHHFEHYYRYRKSANHPWGAPIPIPDNPMREIER